MHWMKTRAMDSTVELVGADRMPPAHPCVHPGGSFRVDRTEDAGRRRRAGTAPSASTAARSLQPPVPDEFVNGFWSPDATSGEVIMSIRREEKYG